MIVTKQKLQQLINEEFSRAVAKRRGRRLVETPMSDTKVQEKIFELVDAVMEWVRDDVEEQNDEITNEDFVAALQDELISKLTDYVMEDIVGSANAELESLFDERHSDGTDADSGW